MQTIWLSQNKVRGKFCFVLFFNVQTSKSSKKLLGKWNIWVNQRKIYLVQKKFCTQFSTEVDKITCRYCSGLHSEFTHALIVEHVIKYLCNSLLCDIVLLFQYFIVKLPRISLYSSIVELVWTSWIKTSHAVLASWP